MCNRGFSSLFQVMGILAFVSGGVATAGSDSDGGTRKCARTSASASDQAKGMVQCLEGSPVGSPDQPPLCKDLAQESWIHAGASCKTSKGKIFVRESDGWKDVEAKVFWFDGVGLGKNFAEAGRYCSGEMKASLPSREDFRTAELNGFREVFPLMVGVNFWTSEKMNGDEDAQKKKRAGSFAFVFNGATGSIGSSEAGSAIKTSTARCIKKE